MTVRVSHFTQGELIQKSSVNQLSYFSTLTSINGIMEKHLLIKIMQEKAFHSTKAIP